MDDETRSQLIIIHELFTNHKNTIDELTEIVGKQGEQIKKLTEAIFTLQKFVSLTNPGHEVPIKPEGVMHG